MVAMTRRWARARTMAFYLLVATLSAEVGAFSPQLLSSSLLSLMPRKHQKSAHTLAIHRDCLAKSALPRTQAPYLSAPWSRRSCGRCRSPCKMALDSDGDDILYSSRDGEKSVSGSSDLTQAVEIAEQQRFRSQTLVALANSDSQEILRAGPYSNGCQWQRGPWPPPIARAWRSPPSP
jgi:hypothetical protein